MTLLQEIQGAAIDDAVSISTLLRKCAVLASRLENDELRAWVTQELNGYENSESVPDYRVLGAHATGNLAGPFGSGWTGITIPPIVLPKWGRKYAEVVKLVQPIASLEALCADRSTDSVT